MHTPHQTQDISQEFLEFRGFKGVTKVPLSYDHDGSKDIPTVPIVDCAGIFSSDSDERKSVATSVRSALRRYQTLYASNHGISGDLQELVKNHGNTFFSQPIEEKMKYHQAKSPSGKRGYQYISEGREDEPGRHDFREAFKAMLAPDTNDSRLQPSNPWPADVPGFRQSLEEYSVQVRRFVEAFLRTVALAMNAPEDFFADKHGKEQGLCLIRYPKAEGSQNDGRAAHTDYSIITIIDQLSPVQALEAFDVKNGRWFKVPPVPGTLVINVGDFLERMSNKFFSSTIHCVRNNPGSERYSLVYFFDADPEAEIEVAEACVSQKRPLLFDKVKAGEWQKGLLLHGKSHVLLRLLCEGCNSCSLSTLMFRNPRENVARLFDERLEPSVGRAPSPPHTTQPASKSFAARTPKAMPYVAVGTLTQSKATPGFSTSKLNQATLVPLSASKKSSIPGGNFGKLKAKPNGNILTFFKKAEEENNALFVKDKRLVGSVTSQQETTPEYEEDDSAADHDVLTEGRYNEEGGSIKKRRISADKDDFVHVSPLVSGIRSDSGQIEDTEQSSLPSVRNGPFLEDSDSDSEVTNMLYTRRRPIVTEQQDFSTNEVDDRPKIKSEGADEKSISDTISSAPFNLKREATSAPADVTLDAFNEFDNANDDFEDDDFLEGEENVERRWMEEQRLLELAEDNYERDENQEEPRPEVLPEVLSSDYDADAPTCPVCSVGMAGVAEEDITIHVNNCLDGNSTSLPQNTISTRPSASTVKAESGRQFQRPVRPAKPGQANPFTLAAPAPKGSTSAFSKLMTSHTEDAAWATAAAAEKQSRGKPAYQRTCPFYKIMPGFFICVDAFRYGAVSECRAYFLSHFHSDHYIGLTASWSHGPIYCSKVTANLVKQQLRVDSKWVVPIEFEEKIEVPGTQGAFVTMIPANHCPGSSLFLFEKVTGKGKNPKTQRVLHCGDFRACRAHIEHPLLRPDIIDILGNKTGQQKIDACYLDTTYLNPKYAFPPQEEVIKACADMCVSLNKMKRDDEDGWEQMKRKRAGQGMVKFVQKNEDTIKTEPLDSENVDAMAIGTNNEGKPRGRLLVVVGTYSIGKERICLGIARALKSKIYAPPGKQRICAALEDPELNSLLTKNPREAQVHMTPLFEIRAETLDDYLKEYRAEFSRAVGFRPSGWNYRPPNNRFIASPSVQSVLHSSNWKSSYSMSELVPQRGSTSRASCFGVPYSEHSSFRELTMFCCALRIDKIIPTVNIGSPKSRETMKTWCERWATEKKKNGLFKPDGESGCVLDAPLSAPLDSDALFVYGTNRKPGLSQLPLAVCCLDYWMPYRGIIILELGLLETQGYGTTANGETRGSSCVAARPTVPGAMRLVTQQCCGYDAVRATSKYRSATTARD
ncbi:hypothetical protein EJ05DRAFT_489397 [Pseudovirgaria hyperparasitica]|uniref:Fe2OG dioxygenase domain-containing protein n=1 Tax=Pseudovirgaria hyperparasitica TaxID=470096 RepID=A0A6A6VWX0_9PEZI|nr:uncharacterized protein EJ05DRAFT_489397 [Pseudovirgaria hyperparasitica]KAF2754140.1 hypothetical protein EJ05DRAFT_489397 [Pseudovirgaria hyperparasitica]